MMLAAVAFTACVALFAAMVGALTRIVPDTVALIRYRDRFGAAVGCALTACGVIMAGLTALGAYLAWKAF